MFVRVWEIWRSDSKSFNGGRHHRSGSAAIVEEPQTGLELCHRGSASRFRVNRPACDHDAVSLTRYLSALLAFCAAVIALTGPAVDDSKSGVAAIRPTGWASLVVAAIAVALSLWAIHADTVALRAAAARDKTLRGFASSRVADAFQELHDVLVRIIFTAFHDRFPGGANTLRRESSLALCSSAIVNRLEQWELAEPFDHGPWASDVPWGTTIGVEGLLTSHVTHAVTELRDSVVYAAVLPTALVTDIRDILEDPFLGYLANYSVLRGRFAYIEDSRNMPFPFLSQNVSYAEGTGSPTTYRTFCELLDRSRKSVPDEVS